MAFGTGSTGGDWLRPETIVEPGAHRGPASPAMYELRPLSLGELLDRIFSLYRSHFWLFASITAVSASVQVVVQALSLTSMHRLMRNVALTNPGTAGPPPAFRGFASAQLSAYAAALVFFLVSAITQAAVSMALSEVYLNRPITAKASLGAAFRKWARWIGIALWQAGSFLWVFLLACIPGMILAFYGSRTNNTVLTGLGAVLIFVGFLGGFPVGFILYLRNALAIPAAVVERLTIRPAMRRSKLLAAGTKGRIFVVLLIAGCLYWVVGILESPAMFLIMFAPKQEHHIAQAITLLVSFVGRTVVAPVALIGLTLLYFDQRVRKEALDLQLLLEANASPTPAAASGYPGGYPGAAAEVPFPPPAAGASSLVGDPLAGGQRPLG